MSIIGSILGESMLGSIAGSITANPSYFTMTVNSTDGTFKLELANNGVYDAKVVYNNQDIHLIQSNADELITFPDGAGIKTFEIRGIFEGYDSTDGDINVANLLNISRFGQFKPKNSSKFRGSTNLTITATDILDFSKSTSNPAFLANCPSIDIIPNLNRWNVSTLTSGGDFFINDTLFNTYHGDWDTSLFTSKFRMYSGCKNYNQLDNHNHDACTNFGFYRFQNHAYNVPVDMSIPSALSIDSMFRDCIGMQQNIILRNTHNVQNFGASFQSMTAFSGSGATISIDSFKSAVSVFNMFIQTTLTTQNWSDILVQLAGTLRSEDNPVANATQVVGTTVNFNIVGHNLQVGHGFIAKGFIPTAYNGLLTVTSVIDVDNVECILLSDPLGDATTIGTYDLPLNGLNIHGGGSKYNATGQTARNQLTSKQGWTITDAGLEV